MGFLAIVGGIGLAVAGQLPLAAILAIGGVAIAAISQMRVQKVMNSAPDPFDLKPDSRLTYSKFRRLREEIAQTYQAAAPGSATRGIGQESLRQATEIQNSAFHLLKSRDVIDAVLREHDADAHQLVELQSQFDTLSAEAELDSALGHPIADTPTDEFDALRDKRAQIDRTLQSAEVALTNMKSQMRLGQAVNELDRSDLSEISQVITDLGTLETSLQDARIMLGEKSDNG